MDERKEFSGVKAALIHRGNILVYLRDNAPGLRFAGLWDFFGGGREDDETPFECIARELQEELEITITPDQVVFDKIFPAMHEPSRDAHFVVVRLTDDNVQRFKFGNEGQECKFVSFADFEKSDEFVPLLRPRFDSYLMESKTN